MSQWASTRKNTSATLSITWVRCRQPRLEAGVKPAIPHVDDEDADLHAECLAARLVDGAELVDLAAEERHHNVLDQSLGRDVVGPVVVRRAEGADVGNGGDGARENEAHRRLLAPLLRRRFHLRLRPFLGMLFAHL